MLKLAADPLLSAGPLWLNVAMVRLAQILLLAAMIAAGGCARDGDVPPDKRTAAADAQVRRRWGKALAELPTLKLAIISPHNENIQSEFEWAFSLHHAIEHGQKVDISWVDVGGGGTAIEKTLLTLYERSDTSGLDILWGGGEFVFMNLARPLGRHEDGVLERLDLPGDVLNNVPPEFNGVALRDKDLKWIGSATSAFGFLYNSGMLRRCGIAAPQGWDDLGQERFTDLLVLADPSQSGSVAMAYYLIVTSQPDWQAGWAALLDVLSNAKRISDSAGAAANAPVLGDALVATCIDFYGIMRAAEDPDQLRYVNPRGQTTFGPDPIGALKNPPHPELARRFVDFVMSARGQALWALPVGTADGPARSVLGRLPIRRDVYELSDGKLTAGTLNFYERAAGEAADASERPDFYLLRTLIVAAAVDNIDALRAARRKLNELPAGADRDRRLAQFHRLPDDIHDVADMKTLSRQMKDPVRAYEITTRWRDYFRENFRRVAE